jgi:phosphoenolpyruvate-protein phosphotransferase (PTS system enzyme I)
VKEFNSFETNTIMGIAAAPGITIAPAYLYSREKLEISDSFIDNVEEAKKNLFEALERSKYELRKILAIANEKMGEKRAAIFEAQIMILDDPVLIDSIIMRIEKEKKSPDFIVNNEISKYIDLMNSSDELYMKERSHDIEDIKNRIIRNLQKKKLKSRIVENVVVITSNLTPADTILFSKSNVKGFITDFGGLTSHAAIVARSLNIPAVVGTHDATKKIHTNDTLIIDGFHGVGIINPNEEQLKYYTQKLEKLNNYDRELSQLKDLPATTIDGREIILRGNIDVPNEIEMLIQNGGRGIGLLRTEQIFGDMDTFPDEEEQFQLYNLLAEKIYPEMIIIRAFDVGGDKFLPHDIKEPNPFLGWRGIRFLLDNIDILKTQIRAVLRASVHKNIKFMLPMVSSLYEIITAKQVIQSCKEELKANKVKFDSHIKVGIMIEVPSAAVMAKEFAAESDFISIGTNDLIQFILAVDRGNDIVSSDYQEFHPAVIRTISHIINNSKLESTLVSMCGEMAGDPFAIPLLVGMGLDSISVVPSAIPYIKQIIRSLSYEKSKKLAAECMKFSKMEDITKRVDKFFEENSITQSKNIFG